MKIRFEPSCDLPDKKYNTGWGISILPTIGFMWVTEDTGEYIDGCRFNNRPAFQIISVAWLFWSVNIFIEEK